MKLKSGTITYSTHSYINFDCDAGLARINVSKDEVLFTHNDMSIGEGTFNIGISHIHSNFPLISFVQYILKRKPRFLNIRKKTFYKAFEKRNP